MHPMDSSLHDRGHARTDARSTPSGSRRSSPTPASACTSPTTCSWPSGPPSGAGTTPASRRTRPLSLDPATAVLHYAQEIFEGMKAYRHADGSVWTFRPEENAARMVRSARRLALPELPVEDFVASVDALVRADQRWVPEPAGEKSLYVRPFMFASETFLGVRPAAARHLPGDRLARRRLLRQGPQAGVDLAQRGLHPRRARRHGRGQDRRQLRQLAGRPAGGHRARAATRWSSSTPRRAGTSRSSAG